MADDSLATVVVCSQLAVCKSTKCTRRRAARALLNDGEMQSDFAIVWLTQIARIEHTNKLVIDLNAVQRGHSSHRPRRVS